MAIITNDGHEGTLEVLKYIDNILFNFLNNLFNDNLFNNTTIFLVSDHGTGTVSPYYINEFYNIERHLPMLYIICNDRKIFLRLNNMNLFIKINKLLLQDMTYIILSDI